MMERFPSARILLLFFSYLSRTVEEQFESLRNDIRGARFSTTYHGYLARTMIYAVVAFLLVMTLLVGVGLVFFRPGALSARNQILLLGGFVFPSVLASYGVYRARLYYPRYVAGERARAIELSMLNAVNFMMALSRAGVSTSEILRVMSLHADVLGEAADEMRYAWRDMEFFGADVVAALRYLSRTTALEEFSEFLEGYIRSLSGRGDVDGYLQSEMGSLFDQAQIEQEDFLSTLGVLAEVYVAVFVAFPIFGLIILMVMGFIGGNVITGIRAVVYAVIPLSAISYLVLLDVYMTNPLAGGSEHRQLETANLYERFLASVPVAEPRDPERVESQLQSLSRYRLTQRIARFVGSPLTIMRRNPIYSLYLGLALGTGYFLLKVALGLASPDVPLVAPIPTDATAPAILRAIDDALVEAILIVLLVYGVFYELRARYLNAIERALPEFLNELSDRHDIGMSLAESIRDLGRRDMGRLDEEIDRMERDLELGSSASETLRRFANRVRSPVATRIVVLLTAASDTAERLGPVIEALAERAELSQRLTQERRIEMSLYVVIIYISFLVFLVILTVLNDVFLPRIPEGGFQAGGFGSGGFNPVAYQTVFYHSTIVQALFGGLVGGKMSEGSVSAGVKHAFVMITIAYFVFAVVLPNVTISL